MALSPFSAWIGRSELKILLTLLLLAGALFGFVSLAGEVLEGETRAFDHALLVALRNPADLADPIGPLWLEIMFRDLTSLGSATVLTLVTAASAAYLAMSRKRGAAALVVAAVGGGTLLSMLLKLGFDRPRPHLVAHLVEAHDPSFPSGHAMLSAVTYLTLGVLLARVQRRNRLRIYLLALSALATILIGISRVYLGVHWPTDVLAGWCIGAGWALACWFVALWLQRRGNVENDAPADAEAD